MNDYKITFAPELNITPSEFADSWNKTQSCRNIAETIIKPVQQSDYSLGEVEMLAVLVLIGNIVTSTLKEFIKQAITEHFKKRKQADRLEPEPEIEVREIAQPDGSKIVVVILK